MLRRFGFVLIATIPALAGTETTKDGNADARKIEIRSHFLQALRCEREGRAADALKHYARVLRLDPNHRASRRALGFVRTKQGWRRPSVKSKTESIGALVRRALFGKKTADRMAAVAILRNRRPEKARTPFLRALRSSRFGVRLRAIQALERLGDPAALPALLRRSSVVGASLAGALLNVGGQLAYLRDYDVEVG